MLLNRLRVSNPWRTLSPHSWLLLVAWFVAGAAGGAAVGHEGHDHGAPPAVVSSAFPRVAVHSDAHELVGIFRDGRLVLYLDRFADNAPVNAAKITVAIDGDEVAAEAQAQGTYTVSSPRFSAGGEVELVFTITSAEDDLLIGTLRVPAIEVAGAPPDESSDASSFAQYLRRVGISHTVVDHPVGVAAVLILGLATGIIMRRGRRLVPATLLVLLTLILSAAGVGAHENHDHGSDQTTLGPMNDTPRRLPDGSVFVPKPTQRLLEVRTIIAKPQALQRSITLLGRIIADSNRSGVVQSINGGRVTAPDKGLARIGQAVKKGEVLATVEPALPQADRTTISERVGEIEQQIATAEIKLGRIRQLIERNVAPASQLIDAEAELIGLRRRREIVRETRVALEVLRAPLDGTISNAKVVVGQVVQAQDILFQIVDPNGLWVEAFAYGEFDPTNLSEATASGTSGSMIKLTFSGVSRALQQQATVLHFAITDPPPSLSVGQPLTVLARTGEPVTGIILPREAIVRGANGEAVVWRHKEPEEFDSRSVRTAPLDAANVLVSAGVAEGDRIVVKGAELINQVR